MADPPGLVTSTTDGIRLFLSNASNDPLLSEELRQSASDLFWQSYVPYAILRSIWMASNPSKRPLLSTLFSGSDLLFSSPSPEYKSEELAMRLKELEDLAERNAYQELVKDIPPQKAVNEPFSANKDQRGFGLHVVLTMLTGYLLGHALFRALFSHNPAANAAGGVLGLVGGMLVETFLFIIRSCRYNKDFNKIRSSNQKLRSSISSSKLKKN